MKTIRDILSEKGDNVISISPQDTLQQAVDRMSEYKIGAILVLGDNQSIEGILSERDIVRTMQGKSEMSLTEPVSAIMTRKVMYIKPDMKLDECLQLMTEKRFRHLPVVDTANSTLLGIVSIGDVVKLKLTECAMKIGELEYFIANSY